MEIRKPAVMVPLDLLPCPFCGERPKVIRHTDARGEWVSIFCETQGCTAPETGGRLGGEAEHMWNRRAYKSSPTS